MKKLTKEFQCDCGQVIFRTTGPHIIAATCYCDDCQKAARQLPILLDTDGGTAFVLHRKDKINPISGTDHLSEFKLNPTSRSRRIITTCCKTPMFFEFLDGHWLSIYKNRFNEEERPQTQIRTMTKYKNPDLVFNDSIPSPESHNFYFIYKLLTAWIAMGFKSPKIDYINSTNFSESDREI